MERPAWSLVAWIEANAVKSQPRGHGRQRSPTPWNSTSNRSGYFIQLTELFIFILLFIIERIQPPLFPLTGSQSSAWREHFH
jgi:hypothetical protein